MNVNCYIRRNTRIAIVIASHSIFISFFFFYRYARVSVLNYIYIYTHVKFKYKKKKIYRVDKTTDETIAFSCLWTSRSRAMPRNCYYYVEIRFRENEGNRVCITPHNIAMVQRPVEIVLTARKRLIPLHMRRLQNCNVSVLYC